MRSTSFMLQWGSIPLVVLLSSVMSVSANTQYLYSQVPAVDCVINPYQVADIASPVSGVIESIMVKRSQQVEAGQALAQLDARVERANVELARYRAGIQSEIQLGLVNHDIDSRRKGRVDSLHRENVLSDDNADEAERESRLSRWKLEQAKELSEVRKLELQRAEEQLAQKTIRAPFSGYILDTFKFKGEYVEDQAIVRMAQLNPLVVEAIVPMEYFGEIRVGAKAEVIPEIVGDTKMTGIVSIVDRIGDTASNTFGVRLVVNNGEYQVPAGLKCMVKFYQQSDEAIAQQAAELNKMEQASHGQGAVAVSAEDEMVTDTAKKEPITSSEVTEKPDASVTTDSAANSDSREMVADAVDVNDKEPVGQMQEAAADVDQASSQSPTGYLVLIPQMDTQQNTDDLIVELRNAGLTDLLQVDQGPHAGYIMMGLFSTPFGAQNRLQAIEKLGITGIIRERY